MSKKRVLFVCVGNACRSQMAEGFAAHYGHDVLQPFSAGLSPAFSIPPQTRMVMDEKGVDLDEAFPKPLSLVDPARFDIIVNLSGYPLPGIPAEKVRDWQVEDPIGAKDIVHRRVRDQVESLVISLILELRNPSRRI